jgi:hypothetical protein
MDKSEWDDLKKRIIFVVVNAFSVDINVYSWYSNVGLAVYISL